MFLSAWAVDGSKVPASMARRESYNRSKGNGGITRAEDLEVVELPTPGAAVRIMPGGATIQNTYAGASGQAYGIANDAAFDLAVPATGSGSGATRYVIVRIDDPEFGGQNPAEPLTAPYNYPTLVSSITGLTYPFEVLAKITQPPSTATITQALITDMRTVANPNEKSVLRAFNIISGQEQTLTQTASVGSRFPVALPQEIVIPTWATHMHIVAMWSGVLYPGGNGWGDYWVEFGPQAGTGPWERKYSIQKVRWDMESISGNSRATWMAGDNRSVPDDIRGTSQVFIWKANINGGSSKPSLTVLSSMTMQVVFSELAG